MAGKVTTQAAISRNAVHNAGATIVYAGNISSNSPVTKAISLEIVGANQKAMLHTVPGSGATTSLTCAKSNLNWAKMVPGEYVILGYSSKLGGVANSVIASSAGDYPDGNKTICASQRTMTIEASNWNWVTGKPGSVSGVANTWWSISATNNSATADEEARPTRSVPGELTVLETGKTPTQKDYKALTD